MFDREHRVAKRCPYPGLLLVETLWPGGVVVRDDDGLRFDLPDGEFPQPLLEFAGHTFLQLLLLPAHPLPSYPPRPQGATGLDGMSRWIIADVWPLEEHFLPIFSDLSVFESITESSSESTPF